MKRYILLLGFILYVSFVCNAQAIEQAAIGLAESKHQEFTSNLTRALSGERDKMPNFGDAGGSNQKQFLLEDKAKTFEDFLGWKKKKFDKKRSLLNVFRALLDKVTDRKAPVSVKADLSSGESTFRGKAKNKGKDIKDTYTVITNADAIIEVSKQGINTKSIAKNSLTLTWSVLIKTNKGGDVDVKKSNATLKSISIKSVDLFPSEKQQMQRTAEEAIKKYYQDLQGGSRSSLEIPSDWREQIDNSVLIETQGAFDISEPSSRKFRVPSQSVPSVKIFVDPDPYMPEGSSNYLTHDAFYTISLSFDVEFSVDLEDVTIAPSYPNLASSRLEKPQPKPYEPPIVEEIPEPVSRGITFKVQVLASRINMAIENLPQEYRNIADLVIEEASVGGVTWYKYVISVGDDLRDAVRKRRELTNKGIEAWIATYEDGQRVHPPH